MRTVLSSVTLAGCLSLCVDAYGAGGPQPGALSPNTIKLPDGPGSIRGLADDATVDIFSAQVDYTVPIETPHTYGLSPALSLAYSGALGNGPMGVGWSLEQVRIERSLRRGVPNYDETDELTLIGLGGGRLVPAGDGTYRIEGRGNEVKVEKAKTSARTGRNPQTGEAIQVPAGTRAKVTAGSKLKAAGKS